MSVTTESMQLPSDFFGQKTCIIAKSGYGKSYAARVIIEESQDLKIPIIIFDPQDAHLNHKGIEYIKASAVKSASYLGMIAAKTSKSMCIRLKGLMIEEQNEFVNSFLKSYRQNVRKGIQHIVIDEIHKFCPKGEKTDAKSEVRAMFQENRSDGLGITGITQRPARMDKTSLSQCDNYIMGRVTSFRDKEAVKNYLDSPDIIEQISSFKKGQFIFIGTLWDEPLVAQVREAKTKHSGDSPKDILNERPDLYRNHIDKAVDKGQNKMSDNKTTDIVNDIVPSAATVWDMAKDGMKMSLGLGISGVVGAIVGSRFKSPIPYVSSRTLAAAATTVVLYTAYRMTKKAKSSFVSDKVSDVLRLAAAGSSAYLVGSLVYDVFAAFKKSPPAMAAFVITTATGASPIVVENVKANGGDQRADVNTAFA